MTKNSTPVKLIISLVVKLECWWTFQTLTPHFLLSEYWFDPKTQKGTKRWVYIEDKVRMLREIMGAWVSMWLYDNLKLCYKWSFFLDNLDSKG